MTRTCAIYCRISDDREGAGLGVERQREDCVALAERLGYTVVGVYSDNDVSAYSGKPRRDYRRMLEAVSAGGIGAVLVWHTDRLHRSPKELEEYIDLCETRGVVTHVVTAGQLDLETPTGRMVARLLGATARYESEHKAERVRRRAYQRAAEGGSNGGPRPFGFEPDGLTVNKTEAGEIKNATAAVLSGDSVRSLVTDFNRRGVLTSSGRQWEIQSMRLMLVRPRNAGLRQYRGQEIATKKPLPAIVSEPDYRALVALLSDPARRTSPGNQPRHLGGGIFQCGGEGCGGTVVVGSGGTPSRPRYRCRRSESGPGHITRDLDVVDRYVTARILDRLSRDDAAELLAQGTGEDTGALLAEKAAHKAKLDGLADALADDRLTLDQVARATAKIREAMADLDRRIAAAAVADPLAAIIGADDVEARWKEMHLDTRRGIVRELVEVTILPGRPGRRKVGEDREARVQVEWKRGAAVV